MTTRDLVDTYFAAANQERWDDLLALFHEDAVVNLPAIDAKRGHEEIRRFYESVPRQFADHYDDPRLVLVDGDDAMASIEFTGTSPDRSRRVHFWAADTFRFEDGRIRSLRIVFDPGRLRGE